MKQVIISPFSRSLPDGRRNPKDYPYWSEVIKELKKKDIHLLQIGVIGEKVLEGVDEFLPNLSLEKLADLAISCDTWVSRQLFSTFVRPCSKARSSYLGKIRSQAIWTYAKQEPFKR